MSVFDNLKGKAEQLKDKAADLVDQHSDKIHDGVDKAAAMADQKTGGKYTDKIATGKSKIRGGLDSLDNKKDDFPAERVATPDPSAPATPVAPILPAATIPPARPADQV